MLAQNTVCCPYNEVQKKRETKKQDKRQELQTTMQGRSIPPIPPAEEPGLVLWGWQGPRGKVAAPKAFRGQSQKWPTSRLPHSFWPKQGIRCAPIQGEIDFTSWWEWLQNDVGWKQEGWGIGTILESVCPVGACLFIGRVPCFLEK